MAKNKLAKLDPRYIDDAIETIEEGTTYKSCIALEWATAGEVIYYPKLYREYVESRNGGELPDWWDGANTKHNRESRIRALRYFKGAILSAQMGGKSKPSLEDMIKKAQKHLIAAQEMLNKINDEFES